MSKDPRISAKKGFTAPVLKGADSSNIKEDKPHIIHEKKKIDSNGESYKKESKTTQCKKPTVSLTDSQYEEIFSAVIKGQRSNSKSRHSTPGDEDSELMKISKENTPTNDLMEICHNLVKRSLSEEICPKTPTKQITKLETKTPPSRSSKSLPTLSPWGSHFGKHPSQASSILKELQESQSSLMNSSTLMSPETTSTSDDEDGNIQSSQKSLRQLSQVSGYGSQNSQTLPATKLSTDQRRRLENLQELRNVGVWVYCCRPTCQKQRYLADVTDPQDVPNIWYCHMNSDPKYNSCKADEQKLSPEEEADMIYNEFTAGSLVWARVTGYPWWPAMVDDDPDIEQYYWLDDDDVTVTFYHVVFFDKEAVTRAWVTIKNIAPYGKIGSCYRQKTARGIDFSSRIIVAKEQANAALLLNTSERLKIYSFIARYTGPINTSDSKVKNTMKKYKLKSKSVKKESKKKSTKKERKTSELTVNDKSSNKVSKQVNKQEYALKRKKRISHEEISCSNSKLLKSNRKKSVKTDKKSELPDDSIDGKIEKLEGESKNFMEILLDDSNGENSTRPGENSTKPASLHNTEESLGDCFIEPSQVECKAASLLNTEESLGDCFIEPSQVECKAEDRLSQSTNVDFSSAQHGDAIVPDGNLSQLSEPFEE